MPPKAATTSWPPRRTSRSIARRSKLNDSTPTVNSPLSPSSSSTDIVTAISTSSSTFTPTTPKSSRKSLPINSPITEIAIQEPPSATFSASQTPPRNTKLDTNLGAVMSDEVSINIAINKEKVTFPVPEKANIQLETGTVIESENEVNLSQEKAGAGLDSGVNGVEGSRKGKRVIVRKTVRVVKRVIRRVPKRVLMIESENQGLGGKTENVVNLTEVTDSDLVNDAIGQSNSLDKITEKNSLVNDVKEMSNAVADDLAQNLKPAHDSIEKCNIVNEIAKTSSTVDEVNEISLKFDNNTHVLEPVVGGIDSDQTVIDSMEMETSQTTCKDGVSEPIIGEIDNDLSHIDFVETKTSRINVGKYVMEQMVDKKGNDQSAIYSMETDNKRSNGVMAEVEKESTDSMEVGKVTYAAKSTIKSVRTTEIENSAMKNALEDSVTENENMDTVSKEVVWLVPCQNAGPVEMENGVSYEGNNGSPRKPESGNDGVECCSVVGNEGLLLSGEMEAFERRKRRKTEIFIGGLDKDTKEDDIRKVFEEAGAVLEARIAMSNSKGKNRRFGFVRFATAADAKNALEKYPKVEIYGKQCHTELVEGNDTIFLGNIDRKWKTEDVVQLLKKAGIEKIDKVTLKADPNNLERNRGFAFVEFETFRDAQSAFNKFKKKNLFGKNLKVRVAWAQPINEPAEEEILKVKSVYAEYLPSSWNEGKVEEYFKRFGEIEGLVLSKDLPSSKRNDFAFINYTTRDSALACIEAVSKERSEENGSQVKISISLAKPVSMSRHTKHASDPTKKQLPKEQPKVSQATMKLREPNNGRPASISYHRAKVNTSSSTTEELVRILRQQASSNHIPPHTSIGTITQNNHFPTHGNKRPFQGHDPLYMEPRGLPRARLESSYPVSGPSALSHIVSMASFPYHRQGPGFKAEPEHGKNIYPSHYQTREQNSYYGNNNIYRRY